MTGYLNEAATYLQAVPEADRQELLRYYEEFFSDSGLSQSEIEAQYGTPKQFARTVLAEYLMENDDAQTSTDEPVPTKRSRTQLIWIIILAIFASPILLPVAFAIVVAILGLLFLLVMAIVIAFALLVSGFFAGLGMFVSGVLVFGQSVATALFFTGLGLFAMGITIFLFPIAIKIVAVLVDGFMTFVKFIGRKAIARTKRNRKGE